MVTVFLLFCFQSFFDWLFHERNYSLALPASYSPLSLCSGAPFFIVSLYPALRAGMRVAMNPRFFSNNPIAVSLCIYLDHEVGSVTQRFCVDHLRDLYSVH